MLLLLLLLLLLVQLLELELLLLLLLLQRLLLLLLLLLLNKQLQGSARERARGERARWWSDERKMRAQFPAEATLALAPFSPPSITRGY